jgi:hypothetical protein
MNTFKVETTSGYLAYHVFYVETMDTRLYIYTDGFMVTKL